MVTLTTKDNPFDPFKQFDQWNNYDIQHGYNTLALLARICITSSEATEQTIEDDWEHAIDDVLKYVDYGIYEKVNSEKDTAEDLGTPLGGQK